MTMKTKKKKKKRGSLKRRVMSSVNSNNEVEKQACSVLEIRKKSISFID